MEIIKTQEEDNRISYTIIDPSPEFIEFLKKLQERKELHRRNSEADRGVGIDRAEG